jgi:large subunit ribosomal protein L24
MKMQSGIHKAGAKAKLKVRKGDRVMIISGKDKGQTGYVHSVDPFKHRLLVLQESDENPDQPLPLNTAVKHRKARTAAEKSARIRIPVPIHVSNVMVLDPKGDKPTRLGRKRVDGKLVRFAKKSGQVIIEEPFSKE